MEVKVGLRLRSVVGDTEVIVVKAPGGELEIRCGGHPMVGKDDESSAVEPAAGCDGSSVVGKRYADDELGLELLVTRGGPGTLAVGDVPLAVKDPKRLPSSD
jgi:hypothetical protein